MVYIVEIECLRKILDFFGLLDASMDVVEDREGEDGSGRYESLITDVFLDLCLLGV